MFLMDIRPLEQLLPQGHCNTTHICLSMYHSIIRSTKLQTIEWHIPLIRHRQKKNRVITWGNCKSQKIGILQFFFVLHHTINSVHLSNKWGIMGNEANSILNAFNSLKCFSCRRILSYGHSLRHKPTKKEYIHSSVNFDYHWTRGTVKIQVHKEKWPFFIEQVSQLYWMAVCC